MSSTADTKAPKIITTVTITRTGKAGMTFADFAAEEKQAAAVREANKGFGDVQIEVAIGKQTLKL